MSRKLRSYIDDQNVRFAEEKKEAKSKVAAAKEKVTGNMVVYSVNLDHCFCYIVFMIS